MILVRPSAEIEGLIDGKRMLERIERAGRTCYKSEDRIGGGTAERFVKMILGRNHESVLEHESVSVRFVVDRGVSHELVRHRLCAFSQESTRYCNYKGGVAFVIPPWVDAMPGEYRTFSDGTEPSDRWWNCMLSAEADYVALVQSGWNPQQARSILPNSLKTEIVTTSNLREWRHIFELRTSAAAHPQMREVMVPLLSEFKSRIPVVFDDLE